MKFKKTKIIVVIATSMMLLIGCSSNSNSPASGEKTQVAAVPVQPGGAQLWAENCSRCHNLRAPESYNDAQWHAVVHHMRLRADLDGNEARLITEFMQASH
jgi:cytochrome c5